MKCAIAIFAKTVGLSPVKTRLAASIGEEKATEFYKLSLACVESTLNSLANLYPDLAFPVWAMAEENAPKLTEPHGFPALWTGEGGLGSRLAHISEALFQTHDAVMMIGTDSPQLNVSNIIDALGALSDPNVEAVSGPAHDGGYYLFASNKPVARELWEGVTYSVSSTLNEFETLLEQASFRLQRVSVMQDVDELADLHSLQTYLEAAKNGLSKEQVSLLDWLKKNADYFESAV